MNECEMCLTFRWRCTLSSRGGQTTDTKPTEIPWGSRKATPLALCHRRLCPCLYNLGSTPPAKLRRRLLEDEDDEYLFHDDSDYYWKYDADDDDDNISSHSRRWTELIKSWLKDYLDGSVKAALLGKIKDAACINIGEHSSFNVVLLKYLWRMNAELGHSKSMFNHQMILAVITDGLTLSRQKIQVSHSTVTDS